MVKLCTHGPTCGIQGLGVAIGPLDGAEIMVRDTADFRLDDAHAKADICLSLFRPIGRYKGLYKISEISHRFLGVDGGQRWPAQGGGLRVK